MPFFATRNTLIHYRCLDHCHEQVSDRLGRCSVIGEVRMSVESYAGCRTPAHRACLAGMLGAQNFSVWVIRVSSAGPQLRFTVGISPMHVSRAPNLSPLATGAGARLPIQLVHSAIRFPDSVTQFWNEPCGHTPKCQQLRPPKRSPYDSRRLFRLENQSTLEHHRILRSRTCANTSFSLFSKPTYLPRCLTNTEVVWLEGRAAIHYLPYHL